LRGSNLRSTDLVGGGPLRGITDAFWSHSGSSARTSLRHRAAPMLSGRIRAPPLVPRSVTELLRCFLVAFGLLRSYLAPSPSCSDAFWSHSGSSARTSLRHRAA